MRWCGRKSPFLVMFWCGSMRTNVMEGMALTAIKPIRISTRTPSWRSWSCRPPFLSPSLRSLAVAGLAGSLVFSAGAERSEAQDSGCQTIPPGAKVHVVLSEHKSRVMFCFKANKGQTLTVETSNYGDTVPSGHVTSPSGAVDGAQGRTIFRGELTESGIYRIDASQRGNKKGGSYDLSVDLK